MLAVTTSDMHRRNGPELSDTDGAIFLCYLFYGLMAQMDYAGIMKL